MSQLYWLFIATFLCGAASGILFAVLMPIELMDSIGSWLKYWFWIRPYRFLRWKWHILIGKPLPTVEELIAKTVIARHEQIAKSIMKNNELLRHLNERSQP